jgi:hypothetical protein
MPLAFEPANIRYVAYIDEAGDPGLTRVRPINPDGASEWLSVGAFVIPAEIRHETATWQWNIRQAIRSRQRRDLHFRDLEPFRKRIVCQELVQLPIRCFVVLSNKQNMLNYKNELAALARPSAQEWFYNWCIRLLLERVTDFVHYRSREEYGHPTHVQLIFSERGGVRYAQTDEYHELLREQAKAGLTYKDKRVVKWQVMHPASTKVVPHARNAGVQLADAIASAFYQAVNTLTPAKWDTTYAEMLRPLIPEEFGSCADYGVTLQPVWDVALNYITPEQRKIFRFYGYPIRP